MSEDKISEILVDFANALESASVKLKMEIAPKFEDDQKWTWNPEAIMWQKAQGSKGEFERSDDVNNHDFKALLKDLADHTGKLSRQGFFYWTFTNGSVVGRKPKRKG